MSDLPQSIKIDHQDPLVKTRLTEQLTQYYHKRSGYQELVIVCVGTDRSTGDALGPFVGSELRRNNLPHLYVYGTIDEPVHAMNLNENLSHIYRKFRNPFIIAIDACLGQVSSVGSIQIGDGPVKPGAGVNKDLPEVGDIHITGIVNVGGFMEYFVLQNTRLSLVIRLAHIISDAIIASLPVQSHVLPPVLMRT